MPTRKIVDLLDEDHSRFSPLQRLLATSSNQSQWTAELRALLEPPLSHAVSVTDIRGPVAYILCSSAGHATRLRFELAELLPQLRNLSSFARVKECKIRIDQGQLDENDDAS
ncbi:MAG: DciA family protein [Pseudomonadota bacterium]